MRIDKYIRVSQNITRNDARQIIKKKRVRINDTIVTDNSMYVLDNDKVYLDDKEIIYKEFYYLMLNKPKGYVCAKEDKLNKILIDLISDEYNKEEMIIVGRLDIDTTGLIFITNDGPLTHKLTSPKFDLCKKYFVETDCAFSSDDIKAFEEGVTIFETIDTPYKCKKANLEICSNPNNAYITITEGKYHQVKKMCKSCGHDVLNLKRVSVDGVNLDPLLKEGEYRELTEEELNILKK